MATKAVPDSMSAEASELGLQELAGFHQAVIEHAFDGAAIVELDGRLRHVTAAAERMMGVAPGSLTGRWALERIHPEDMALAERSLEQLLVNPGLRLQLVLRARHENGTYRYLELCGVNMAHDPAIRGILTTFRDVTEAVQADQRLRKSRQRLRRVLRTAAARQIEHRKHREELEGFAFSASHDLRAPLRAVQGYAHALLEDYEATLDGDGREHLDHIINAAQQMDAFLSDLLVYSRVVHREMPIGPTSLATAVAEACGSLQSEISATRAIVEIAPQLPTMRAHHSTLVRVIANILSNGLKFVAPGTIPRLRIDAVRRGGRVRLQVHDNGIGVRPEQHEKIFELFERLHGEERYPGTGIGLAIVKRAVNRFAGQCGVESQLGAGSCFWIELPEHELWIEQVVVA